MKKLVLIAYGIILAVAPSLILMLIATALMFVLLFIRQERYKQACLRLAAIEEDTQF